MIYTKKVKTMALTGYDAVKECDRCHKKFDVDFDVFEFQEFHHIKFTGGYKSVFGDGVRVECDLCQHCLKELISSYCRCYKSNIVEREVRRDAEIQKEACGD